MRLLTLSVVLRTPKIFLCNFRTYIREITENFRYKSLCLIAFSYAIKCNSLIVYNIFVKAQIFELLRHCGDETHK